MNWYCFLGHDYSFFNVIVSCLIALKTYKKFFGSLPSETPPGICPKVSWDLQGISKKKNREWNKGLSLTCKVE